MKVKVCGIKNAEDAEIAIRSGADALGLLVGRQYNSPDFISPDAARTLAERCPPYVTPVLVTHLTDADEIFNIARHIGCSTIQLHSSICVEHVVALRRLFLDRMSITNIKLIKSVSIVPSGIPAILAEIDSYLQTVNGFILDTADKERNMVGGTGLTHDWRISRRIVTHCPHPIILAGGLHSENVAAAISDVQPFAVDANSMLKNSFGYKDERKVFEFVRSAKLAFFATNLL